MYQPLTDPSDLRRLIRIVRSLEKADRALVLALAERLAEGERTRPADLPAAPAEPAPLPRPAQETVVAAIRRLSQTYSMLERGAMLSETSALMSAHVLQGRTAADVIDDLERLFARHYRALGARAPDTDSTEEKGAVTPSCRS